MKKTIGTHLKTRYNLYDGILIIHGVILKYLVALLRKPVFPYHYISLIVVVPISEGGI